jgi:outer membrane protein assembly factor BamD (BamD/ComL family)
MSIIGILASNLFASAATQSAQNAQNGGDNPAKFQQIKTEFQQLGQDLQSGNLPQAQKDYATITQDVPGLSASQNANNPVVQAFHQLGQDLQAGNLQAAQGDYATVQQDAQQNAAQAHGHHRHHHHAENSGQSGSDQQQNSINQAFGQLAQALQAGNLTGAQSAFATLQNDLQQIGGLLPGFTSTGSGSSGGGPIPGAAGTLSVSA